MGCFFKLVEAKRDVGAEVGVAVRGHGEVRTVLDEALWRRELHSQGELGSQR